MQMLSAKNLGVSKIALSMLFAATGMAFTPNEAEARGPGCFHPGCIALSLGLSVLGEAIVRRPSAQAAPRRTSRPAPQRYNDWGSTSGGGYYKPYQPTSTYRARSYQPRRYCGPRQVVHVEYIPTYNGYVTRYHYRRKCYYR